MKKKSDASRRLEQALRLWEDVNYVGGLTYKTMMANGKKPNFAMEPPYEHAHELRRELLGSYGAIPDEGKDFERFLALSDHYYQRMSGLALLPICLYNWTISSRRVYHLPTSLQTLLEWTSLEEMRWGDIEWPFPSFSISLERPLVDSFGFEYDSILFSIYETINEQGQAKLDRDIAVMLFSSRLEGYPGFSKDDRKQMQRYIDQGKTRKLEKMMEAMESLNPSVGRTSPIRAFMFSIDKHADDFVTAKALDLQDNPKNDAYSLGVYALMESALHIVAGLALYLDSLEPKEAQQNRWQPAERETIKNLRCITDQAQICEVECVSKLTEKDKQFLAAVNEYVRVHGHMGMPVHWRRGYWRRKPGFGSVRFAKRNVRVSPALINQHLIAEFLEAGVPVGSMHLA